MNVNFKKLLFSCLLLLGISTSKLLMAQSPCTTTTNSCNYLSNGGFENMDGLNCDDLHATGASVYCIGNNLFTDNTFHGCSWTAGGWTYSGTAQTADYFNACASTCWVPGVNSTDNHGSNGIGSISPHNGNGYAGIFVYTSATAFPGGSASYKESIKQTLSTPLIAGKTYIVSMWVRLAHISKYAVSDFWLNGINFTSSPITDKNNWTFLSTCYTPTATVTQIEIGSNATTLTDVDPTGTSYGTNYGQLNTVSYYYIDDVSIKPFNVNAGPDIISLFPGCGTQIGSANGGYTCLPAGATIAYNWSPSTGLSASNVATPIASPNATTNYTVTATVTYTNEAGVTAVCSSTDAVFVDVVTPTINITPSFTCNFNGVSSFTATPSPAGSYTYSWTVKDAATGTVVAVAGSGTTSATPSFSLHNVIRPVNICVSITNIYGCISTPTCYYLPNCCPTGTNIINYANTTYSTTTTLASATNTNVIVLSGTITVNSGGTLILASKEVLMNPNTKIVLNGSGKISIASDYVHGCNYMWDGIYANGSTSGVTINNSRVEDAKRVVIDSLGGASVTMLNSYINKNNMGVAFKATKTSASVVNIKNTLFTCSNISTAGSVPKIPTTVNLTNAPTLGAFTSTVMLPPYNTQKSYSGIYFENASHTGKVHNGVTTNAITIGGTTGQENIFDKIQYGAYINGSNDVFQNNVFQNIKNSIAPVTGGANNAAVLVVGSPNGANSYYSQIGGTSSAFKNTFRNNDFGVADVLQSTLLITYNTFSTQTTGIYMNANNNGQTVNIRNNNFYQSNIGINCYANSYVTTSIKDNNFDNTASAVGSYADNYAVYCTEATLATNTGAYPAFDIDNNKISGFYNGIYTSQTLLPIIYDNEVHMRADNATEHWQNGISAANTNSATINNNIVDMPSLNLWSYWQIGINLSTNQVPKVQCNSVNNVNMSIAAGGANLTPANDGIKGNYLQNANYGIWLVNNGQIGNQAGTGGTSADNVWNIPNVGIYPTYNTFAQNNSNPNSDIFFTRSGGGYDLPVGKVGYDASINCNKMFGNNNSAAGTGTTCIANAATPSNAKQGGTSLAGLMQTAEDIALDYNQAANMSLNAAVNLSAADDINDNEVNRKAILRKQLLSNIMLQNVDVQSSPELTSFIAAVKSENTGLLFAVDSLIHQAEKNSTKINAAKNANTSITPNNKVEQSQQQFNDLYLSYLAQNKKLNAAEVVSMEAIATQCPMYYGTAVYQARAVLFDLKKQNYRSACENVSPNASSKRIAQTTDNSVVSTDVNVYPNPANTVVFIDARNYDTVVLKLYDVTGHLVMDKTITNNQKTDINHLSNGIYIYKLYHNDTELKVGKLIITH